MLALTPRGRPLRERFEGPDALAPWLLPIAFAAKQVPERVFALEPGRTCHGGAFRSLARGAPAPERDARVLGELEVHVEPPLVVGLALNGRVVASRVLAELPAEVELVVDPAELERAGAPGLALELVDAASGAPVGARVRVPDPHGGPAFDVRLERWVPPFDALGVEVFPAERAPFVLELPPGTCEDVRVELPSTGHTGHVSGVVQLPANTVDARLRVFVERAEEACFAATSWESFPVLAADLRAGGGVFDIAIPCSASQRRAVVFAEATTADGRSWGSHPIRFRRRGCPGDFIVTLQRASALVLLPANDESFRLQLERDDGIPVLFRSHVGGAPLVIPVLPGAYRLRVYGRPWRIVDRELTVGEGEGRLVFVR